jgi:hypothetical protein
MIDLKTICAKYGLETWLSASDIGKCLLEMKHGWTKNAFGTWISRNDVNGVSLIHLSYLITLMAYLCSQWTPNVQIKYFMFDWSIYRRFVLNRVWKRDSLQLMIFSYVSSTWGIVEIKTSFETWITRNDVNGGSMFPLSYLITLMAYLCSQWTRDVEMKYFFFGRSTGYFVKQWLETWFSPNNDMRVCVHEK